MNSFSKDEQLQQCFISVDDAITTPDERNERLTQSNTKNDIIVSTGAGKDDATIATVTSANEFPFLVEKESPDRNSILSPHADTLGIDDLDDIDSVKSELSN